MWTFTFDSEMWLTIFRNGSIRWEGTYDDFDGSRVPPILENEINHRHREMVSAEESRARRDANHIDGYDRDDLGESPD